MIRKLGEFILASRYHAIAVALSLCLLPFITETAQLISGIAQIIMVLVTLRKGAREGFLLCLWISLPCVVLGLSGRPQFLVTTLFLTNILTWILAVTLAKTRAWTTVIEIGAMGGLLVVLGLHLALPDIQQYWLITLKQNLGMLKEALPTSPQTQLEDFFLPVLPYATGMCWLTYCLTGLFTLAAAHWWQDALSQVRTLATELKKIRLSKVMLLTFIAVSVAAFTGSQVGQDMLPLLVVSFFLAGLSLCHHWLSQLKPFWLWISLFYALGIFFLPLSIIIIVIAVADSLFNFRHRGKQRGNYLTKKST